MQIRLATWKYQYLTADARYLVGDIADSADSANKTPANQQPRGDIHIGKIRQKSASFHLRGGDRDQKHETRVRGQQPGVTRHPLPHKLSITHNAR